MIRKLMAAAATAAILVVAATVVLEAVGLLFQDGAPQHVIASIQTNEDAAPEAMLMRPLEELDRAWQRRQAEQERARQSAGPHDAASQAQEEERYLADALRWAERYRRQRETERRVAAIEPPQQVLERPPEPAPELAGTVAVPERERSSDTRLAAAPDTAGPRVGPQPLQPPAARRHRSRSNRASAGRGDSSGCPFLGWLQALMTPARVSAARTALRRRAT